MKIDRVQIGACLAAGFVGGLIASFLIARPSFSAGLVGISAGDWLQAGAAIVGVALTVWATLWLEEHRRHKERKEEQRLLGEALERLRSVLPSAAGALEEGLDLQRRRLATRTQFEMVRTGLESISYARQAYRIRSYNLWTALSVIDVVHAGARDRITREERIILGDHVTETVLSIGREKLAEFAEQLTGPVGDAVHALEGERL